MELVKFIFSGFWHFIGTLILIGAVLEGLAAIIRAMRGKDEAS